FLGHLVGGAADALAAHLDARLDVLDRLGEHVHRIGALDLGDDRVDRVVEDLLRDALLPAPHDLVDDLAGELVVEARVPLQEHLGRLVGTRHGIRSLLGTLGPVLGTAAAAVLDAGGVEAAAQDVVAHAGQVAHAAAADQHDA